MITTSETFRIPRAYISYIILSCLVSVCALFAWMLVQSVTHVVTLRAIDAEIAEIERDTHNLEMRRVAVIQQLTQDYALDSGYIALDTRMYANGSDVVVAKR